MEFPLSAQERNDCRGGIVPLRFKSRSKRRRKVSYFRPFHRDQSVLSLARAACVLIAVLSAAGGGALAQPDAASKARRVVESAVAALGGDAYRNIRTMHSRGRYFWFSEGRKAWADFQTWTSYRPLQIRSQLGEGGGRYIEIYDLEAQQGWKQKGDDFAEAFPLEQFQQFRASFLTTLDVLLRVRIEEDGMSLFYYGPEEIGGMGDSEAVEFLAADNLSATVYFDLKSSLPLKVESSYSDSRGIRHQKSVEYGNWHVIQGVRTPLRIDTYTDGELSAQRFSKEVVYNLDIPAQFFQQPVIKR